MKCERLGCDNARLPGKKFCGDEICVNVRRVESFDRGTREGFLAYVESNPFYLRDVFGVSAEKAWREILDITEGKLNS
jgi:hypothetical protein